MYKLIIMFLIIILSQAVSQKTASHINLMYGENEVIVKVANNSSVDLSSLHLAMNDMIIPDGIVIMLDDKQIDASAKAITKHGWYYK